MARPPKKAPDRHYNFEGLNQVFAWSSLALLLVTLWMVFADYAKPLKRLQAEFRDLERQKLVAEAEEERQRLSDDEIAQIETEISVEEAALGEQREEIAELDKEVKGFGKKAYAADIRARTTKSKLDTAIYLLDAATQRGAPDGIDAARAEVVALEGLARQDADSRPAARQGRDGLRQP